MHFDPSSISHTFNQAQHVPQIRDYFRLHFNLLGAETTVKPALRKALLTFTWKG